MATHATASTTTTTTHTTMRSTIPTINVDPLDAIVIQDKYDLYVALIQQANVPQGTFEVRPFRGELVVVRAGTTGRDLCDWAGAIRPGISSAGIDFKVLALLVHKMLAQPTRAYQL